MPLPRSRNPSRNLASEIDAIELPDEVVLLILDLLLPADRPSVARVSRLWRALAAEARWVALHPHPAPPRLPPLRRPNHALALGGGRLVVADWSSTPLRCLGPDGAVVWSVAKADILDDDRNPAALSGAGAIAAYGGELYVTDCNDDAVKVYRAADGTHVRTICGSVVQDPNGIAIDGRRGIGYLTCSDDTVRCFSLITGEMVARWGGNGAGRGKFWNPRGLAIVGGELFVVDMHNHRVQARASAIRRDSAQFGAKDFGHLRVSPRPR